MLKLNPVSFVYNDDIGVKGPQVGLIAEQVQQIDPRLVATDPSGVPFTVKYENLTAILAAAIQALMQKVNDLADTVAGFAEKIVTKELVAVNVTGYIMNYEVVDLGTRIDALLQPERFRQCFEDIRNVRVNARGSCELGKCVFRSTLMNCSDRRILRSCIVARQRLSDKMA